MNENCKQKKYVKSPDTPLLIRLINNVGGLLRRMGMQWPRLDMGSLLQGSGFKTQTDDKDLILRLSILIEDAENSKLNFFGRFYVRQHFLEILRNRAFVRQWIKDHPETLNVPIKRPLFVVGLPRTGTTILYNLLAQDPAGRVPLCWELLEPIPPPDPKNLSDRRIERAVKKIRLLNLLNPSLKKIHSLDASNPDEDYPLLSRSAFSVTFGGLYLTPLRNNEHIYNATKEEASRAYADFYRGVQILQYHTSERHWVSKNPNHSLTLGTLLDTFPDGCVVRTHRNPTEVLPSWCSLRVSCRSTLSDHVNPYEVGNETLNTLLTYIRKSEEANIKHGERILDINYIDTVKDPIGTVKRIYDHFSYPFTPIFEERMRAWLLANPQGKHGTHEYSLEQFGLDRAVVEEATADYRRKYCGMK